MSLNPCFVIWTSFFENKGSTEPSSECITAYKDTHAILWSYSHRVRAACYKRYRISLAAILGIEPNLLRLSSSYACRLSFCVNNTRDDNVNQTCDGYSFRLHQLSTKHTTTYSLSGIPLGVSCPMI